jgi:hypothetical protein
MAQSAARDIVLLSTMAHSDIITLLSDNGTYYVEEHCLLAKQIINKNPPVISYLCKRV